MTPSFSSPGFSGRGLSCRRGGRLVFSGLDFDIAPGGALLLLGPNGSGKSSLLRLMAGLTPALAGTLLWGGAPEEDGACHRARLSYLGHLDAVKPTLSAAENLRFWARLSGRGEDHVEAALATFDLLPLARMAAKYLSAGQKRRLNLARLLVHAPPLWLLDEPSVALDSHSIATLEGVLARHRAQGGMVALSTHAPLGLGDAAILRLDAFAPMLPSPEEAWA